MTAQYSFKNHTLRCDWMGNFGFEKIDFPPFIMLLQILWLLSHGVMNKCFNII
jgi:hypothetical protein